MKSFPKRESLSECLVQFHLSNRLFFAHEELFEARESFGAFGNAVTEVGGAVS